MRKPTDRDQLARLHEKEARSMLHVNINSHGKLNQEKEARKRQRNRRECVLKRMPGSNEVKIKNERQAHEAAMKLK